MADSSIRGVIKVAIPALNPKNSLVYLNQTLSLLGFQCLIKYMIIIFNVLCIKNKDNINIFPGCLIKGCRTCNELVEVCQIHL